MGEYCYCKIHNIHDEYIWGDFVAQTIYKFKNLMKNMAVDCQATIKNISVSPYPTHNFGSG